MRRLLSLLVNTRYLAIIHVIGLLILAAVLFVVGGMGLVRFMVDMLIEPVANADELIVDIVEFVHFFLIGTVLYITGMGLFQLFIRPLDLPDWLKIDDIEELELNLVGVVVVIIGVNFLDVIFNPDGKNLLQFGAGYALVIAALAFFVAVRSRTLPRQKENGQDDDT